MLLAASGAAFTTIVVAQLANGFICRSTVHTPWRLGWTTNRLLVWAVLAELVVVALFLFVPVVARAMGHAPPTVAGWAVAALAAPVMLSVDALWKRRGAGGSTPAAGPR